MNAVARVRNTIIAQFKKKNQITPQFSPAETYLAKRKDSLFFTLVIMVHTNVCRGSFRITKTSEGILLLVVVFISLGITGDERGGLMDVLC